MSTHASIRLGRSRRFRAAPSVCTRPIGGSRAMDVGGRGPMAIIYSIWSFHYSHAYSSRGYTKPDGWRVVERKEVRDRQVRATVMAQFR